MTRLPDIRAYSHPPNTCPPPRAKTRSLHGADAHLPHLPLVKVRLLPSRTLSGVQLRYSAVPLPPLPSCLARRPAEALNGHWPLPPWINDFQAFPSQSTHTLITLFGWERTSPAAAQDPPSAPPTDPQKGAQGTSPRPNKPLSSLFPSACALLRNRSSPPSDQRSAH